MARLRFPGRPGLRFDRHGVRYGADEARNVQDPTLAFVASIHRGLLAFREIVGDSDEDDEFEGFTPDDVWRAERRLDEELDKYVSSLPRPKVYEPQAATIDVSPGKLGTRLTTTRESLENLPTSERTRSRKSTVIRKSYKALLKEGIAKPGKLYSIKKEKDLGSAQDEVEREMKTWMQRKSPGTPKFSRSPKVTLGSPGQEVKKRGRPSLKDLQMRESQQHIPVTDDLNNHLKEVKEKDKPSYHFKVGKPGSKGIAHQLLEKAKKTGDKGQGSRVKVQRRRFVLPVQSSRSSRVIIPNKRFLEEDSVNDLHVVNKRPTMEKEVKGPLTVETPEMGLFTSPPAAGAEKLPLLPLSSLSPAIPKTPVLSGISLFQQQKPVISEQPLLDQPLIVEGKRTRKPSLKVRMKISESSYQRFKEMSFQKKLQARKAIEQEKEKISIQESYPETKRILLTPSKLGATLSPKLPSGPIVAPPKFGFSPFSSASERERLEKLEREAHATRMRGHNILRKAKLQLNRAALNRSKADLARTLKKEMKKEAKIEETKQKQFQQTVPTFLPLSPGIPFSVAGRGWSEAIPTTVEDSGPKEAKKKPRRVKLRCSVCELVLKDDKMRYYGIPSCIGCRKFYRYYMREQQQGKATTCSKNNNCKIHFKMKPMCSECRYRKCESVFPTGDKLMKRKSVTMETESGKAGNEDHVNVDTIEENQTASVPEMPQSHVSMATTSTSPLPELTSSPEAGESPRSDGRGPRIKHVCRKAAVVLGKPVAKFPSRSGEITLSALPSGEKVKLWRKEQETRKEYSDDEMPLEEIIQQSEDHSVITKKSPLKSPPKAIGRILKGKRKVRCLNCEGCRAPWCGKCEYCLDSQKFGGPGLKKKTCIERACRFPRFPRMADPSMMDHRSDSDFGDGSPSSSPGKYDKPQGGVARGTTLSLVQRMALQGGRYVGTGGNKRSAKMGGRQTYDSKTPMDVSRQLITQFRGSDQGQGGVLCESANFNLVSVTMPGRRPTKFKDKMYGGLKTDSVALQSVTSARSWIADTTIAEHRIKADYRDNLELVSVWQYGVALTVARPICVRTVCFLCGSAGKHELLYCNICCEPFHEFCLEEEDRPHETRMEEWCCKRCQFCHVCGRQNNLLQCDKCQNTYHPECLGPNYPTKPSKKKNIWICTKCVRCKSCGATTPGGGSGATWTYDFQLCFECGQLMDKGNFCPVCHKCYSDDDWESKMVQCVSCESWVHAKCEGLTDEMYERVSYLPEDIHYVCKICSPEGTRHWEEVVKQDFLTGIKSVLSMVTQAKCAQHLLHIDEEKLKDFESKLETENMDVCEKLLSDVKDSGSNTKIQEDPAEVQRKSRHLEQSIEDFVSMLDKVLKSKTKFEIPPPTMNLNEPSSFQLDSEKKSCDSADQKSHDTDMVESSLKPDVKDGEEVKESERISENSEQDDKDLGKEGEIMETVVRNEENQDGDESMDIDVENDSVSVEGEEQDKTETKSYRDEVDGSDLTLSRTSSMIDAQGKADDDIEVSVSESNTKTENPASDISKSDTKEILVRPSETGSEMSSNTQQESNLPAVEYDTKMEENLSKPENIVTNESNIPEKSSESATCSDQSDKCSEDANQSAIDSSQMSTSLCSQNELSNEITRNSESTLSALSDPMLESSLLNQSDLHLQESKTIGVVFNQSDTSLHESNEINADSSKVQFDLPVIQRGETTPPRSNKGHVRFMDGLFNPHQKRDYPKDFNAVICKVELNMYTTVEEFAEDMARIINLSLNDLDDARVARKKATNSVRSIFVKQLERHFPWYNTKSCKLWDYNQNFPEGMLEDAVLPPSVDHTYAQWLERQDIPQSPQPSPFKKVHNTPIKKALPLMEDEDAEKILYTDLEDAGEDVRRCILCWHYGDSDPNDAGRLLYAGQDDWVHVNCALWSAEVYEEEHDGSLKNVQTAVSRGRVMKCDRCGRSGATVGCNTRGCPANYHFMCAKQSFCMFQEDKKLFCWQHRDKVDNELVRNDKYAVLRRVSVSMEDNKFNKKTWAKGLDPAVISIIIGSCTVEDLGKLSPLSDTKELLIPIDFCSTRVFWSTKDARKRCVYTCQVREVKPDSPKSGQVQIRDMTIIHDVTHPDFVPFSQLDLQGINLFPEKRKLSDSMEIIDLSEEESMLSKTFNLSGDSEILNSTAEMLNSTTDVLSSTRNDGTLSSSFHGQPSERVVGNEDLSKSWPSAQKKQKSSHSKIDLSLLSPKTLKLLNIKDPGKLSGTVTTSVKKIEKDSDDNFGNLIKIADRLNMAAAKRGVRGKSEERSSPGLPPLGKRGRSRSVDRLISPPRMLSPVNFSAGTHSGSSSKSSSRSGSVERMLPQTEASNDASEASISMKQSSRSGITEEIPVSETRMDESLEPINEEDTTTSSNETVIVLPEGCEGLTEEDYLLIAQMALGEGQGSTESDVTGGETCTEPIDVDAIADTPLPDQSDGSKGQICSSVRYDLISHGEDPGSRGDSEVLNPVKDHLTQMEKCESGADDVINTSATDIIEQSQGNDDTDVLQTEARDCAADNKSKMNVSQDIPATRSDEMECSENAVVHQDRSKTQKQATERTDSKSDSQGCSDKESEITVEKILEKDMIPVYSKEHVLIGYKSPTGRDHVEKRHTLHRKSGSRPDPGAGQSKGSTVLYWTAPYQSGVVCIQEALSGSAGNVGFTMDKNLSTREVAPREVAPVDSMNQIPETQMMSNFIQGEAMETDATISSGRVTLTQESNVGESVTDEMPEESDTSDMRQTITGEERESVDRSRGDSVSSEGVTREVTDVLLQSVVALENEGSDGAHEPDETSSNDAVERGTMLSGQALTELSQGISAEVECNMNTEDEKCSQSPCGNDGSMTKRTDVNAESYAKEDSYHVEEEHRHDDGNSEGQGEVRVQGQIQDSTEEGTETEELIQGITDIQGEGVKAMDDKNIEDRQEDDEEHVQGVLDALGTDAKTQNEIQKQADAGEGTEAEENLDEELVQGVTDVEGEDLKAQDKVHLQDGAQVGEKDTDRQNYTHDVLGDDETEISSQTEKYEECIVLDSSVNDDTVDVEESNSQESVMSVEDLSGACEDQNISEKIDEDQKTLEVEIISEIEAPSSQHSSIPEVAEDREDTTVLDDDVSTGRPDKPCPVDAVSDDVVMMSDDNEDKVLNDHSLHSDEYNKTEQDKDNGPTEGKEDVTSTREGNTSQSEVCQSDVEVSAEVISEEDNSNEEGECGVISEAIAACTESEETLEQIENTGDDVSSTDDVILVSESDRDEENVTMETDDPEMGEISEIAESQQKDVSAEKGMAETCVEKDQEDKIGETMEVFDTGSSLRRQSSEGERNIWDVLQTELHAGGVVESSKGTEGTNQISGDACVREGCNSVEDKPVKVSQERSSLFQKFTSELEEKGKDDTVDMEEVIIIDYASDEAETSKKTIRSLDGEKGRTDGEMSKEVKQEKIDEYFSQCDESDMERNVSSKEQETEGSQSGSQIEKEEEEERRTEEEDTRTEEEEEEDTRTEEEEEDTRTEEEKTQILLGLGLARKNKDTTCQEPTIKSYPLRCKGVQGLDEDGSRDFLPLHDQIALRIKAESLAKSSPGEMGPFKCPVCKRVYRTKHSYDIHVSSCDFEVSTSEEEESSKDSSTGLKKYPLRQSTVVKKVVMELEHKERQSEAPRRGRPPKQNRLQMSPKVLLSRLSPSKCQKGTVKITPPRKGRGRPCKEEAQSSKAGMSPPKATPERLAPRGRGRPRKVTAEDSSESKVEQPKEKESEDNQKRRGRPRKDESQDDDYDEELLNRHAPKVCPIMLAKLGEQVERMRNRSSSHDSSMERMERLVKGTLRGGGPRGDSGSSSRSSSRLANRGISMEICNEDSRESVTNGDQWKHETVSKKKAKQDDKKDESSSLPKKDNRGRPPKKKQDGRGRPPKSRKSDISNDATSTKRPIPTARLSLDLKARQSGLKASASKLVKAAHSLSSSRLSKSFEVRIRSRRGRKRLRKKLGDFEYDLEGITSSSSETSDSETEETQETPGKRKRGRRKDNVKQKVTENEESSSESDEGKDEKRRSSTDTPVLPRGRPKSSVKKKVTENKESSSDSESDEMEDQKRRPSADMPIQPRGRPKGTVKNKSQSKETSQNSVSDKEECKKLAANDECKTPSPEKHEDSKNDGKETSPIIIDSDSECDTGKALGDLDDSSPPDEILCEKSGELLSLRSMKKSDSTNNTTGENKGTNTEPDNKDGTESENKGNGQDGGQTGNTEVKEVGTSAQRQKTDTDVVVTKYQATPIAEATNPDSVWKILSHVRIPKGITTDAVKQLLKEKNTAEKSLMEKGTIEDNTSVSTVSSVVSSTFSSIGSSIVSVGTSAMSSLESSQAVTTCLAMSSSNMNPSVQNNSGSSSPINSENSNFDSNSSDLSQNPTSVASTTVNTDFSPFETYTPEIIADNEVVNTASSSFLQQLATEVQSSESLIKKQATATSTAKQTTGPTIVKFSLPAKVSPEEIQRIIQAHSTAAGKLALSGGKMKLTPLLSSDLLKSVNQSTNTTSCQLTTSAVLQPKLCTNQTFTSSVNQSNLSVNNSVVQGQLGTSSVHVLQSSPVSHTPQVSMFTSTSTPVPTASFTLNNPAFISPTPRIVGQPIAPPPPQVYQNIIPMAEPQPAVLPVQQPSPVYVQQNTGVVDPFLSQVQVQPNAVAGFPGQMSPLQGQTLVNPQGQTIISPRPVYQTVTPIGQSSVYTGNTGISNTSPLLQPVNQPMNLNFAGQPLTGQSLAGQGQIQSQSRIVPTQTIQQASSGNLVTMTTPQYKPQQNTIVRIFVDGKPVAMTTDPSVLQDPNKLMSKITTTKLQTGTYSVSVNAHKVKETKVLRPLLGNQSGVTSATSKVKTIYPIFSNPQLQSSLSADYFTGYPGKKGSGQVTVIRNLLTQPPTQLSGSARPSVVVTTVIQGSITTPPLGHPRLIPAASILSAARSHSQSSIKHGNISKVAILGSQPRPKPTAAIQSASHTSINQLSSAGKPYLKMPQSLHAGHPTISDLRSSLLRSTAVKRPFTSMLSSTHPTPAKKAFLSVDVRHAKPVTDGERPRIMKKAGATGNGADNSAATFRKKMLLKIKQKKKNVVGMTENQRKRAVEGPRPVGLPHASGASSHPLIHPQKEGSCLPQPAMEEEVTETPLSQFEFERQKQQEATARKNGPRFMFEINSDDGFSCSADSMQAAWQQVMERVQDVRSSARMKHLSFSNINGASMFGVNHLSSIYLIEQLFGAHNCRNYKFKFHKYDQTEFEEEPPENPSGCVRGEPFQGRKPFDIFNFLMSQYRHMPELDPGKADCVEMVHKSSRRATSMDLPMAMRFRKLKEHSREAVGVYRSNIHGRGLFCKRNIDAGEMVIEYSGEVIRASLTDKREKYYESKGIGCYMFRIDDFDVIDATLHGSAARFINHSCEPNCYSKVIQVDGKKHIVIFAMTVIKRGEELTYDYKFPIEEVKIPCTCNSKRCRKFLN